LSIRFHKQQIPWVMGAARVALGPTLIAGQARSWDGILLGAIVFTAQVLDIFDGILARRWGGQTAAGSLFDSMADTAFYFCAAVAIWIGQPQVVRTNGRLLVVLLALEAVRFAFDFAKFGKPASYHSYLAKLWGVVLLVGVTALFVRQRSNPLIAGALWLGIACDLEGLTMSLVLPAWRAQVRTIPAAWRPPGGCAGDPWRRLLQRRRPLRDRLRIMHSLLSIRS
jgi:phosphatidylglycerophosphate synthase